MKSQSKWIKSESGVYHRISEIETTSLRSRVDGEFIRFHTICGLTIEITDMEILNKSYEITDVPFNKCEKCIRYSNTKSNIGEWKRSLFHTSFREI